MLFVSRRTLSLILGLIKRRSILHLSIQIPGMINIHILDFFLLKILVLLVYFCVELLQSRLLLISNQPLIHGEIILWESGKGWDLTFFIRWSRLILEK